MHKEGSTTIFALLAILLISATTLYGCRVSFWCYLLVLIPEIMIFGVVVNFFRYPKRIFQGDPIHDVIAPSDGTIVTIEEVFEPEYFKDQRIQISIFMSVFNVHAQWSPLAGDILKVSHEDGRFKAAWLPKSSCENERSTIVIKSDAGPIILMRQVAGAMARRIVTYLKSGERSEINDELGFIKFGSRIDLFLPLDSKICVKMGQSVKGNTTTIAKI